MPKTEDGVFTKVLRARDRFSTSKGYVRFDEIEDVLSSTDLMAHLAPLLRKRPWFWKWMVVATHNALQGAIVCALAVVRCWNDARQNTNYEPLVVTDEQLKDIKRLHLEFRNNFVHFTPKSWSIQKAGLPRIIESATDAIDFLMAQDQVIYRMTGNLLRRLNGNLRQIRTALK